jgi:hypothetical protein
LFLLRRVDPGSGRDGWRGRGLADEAFWVGVVGGGQHAGPAGLHDCGAAVVNVGGGVQAEPAVTMLIVVPGEEVLAVRSCCFDRVEAAGEAGPVFQGLELRLRVRIVGTRAGGSGTG